MSELKPTEAEIEAAAKASCVARGGAISTLHQIHVFTGEEPFDFEDAKGRRFVYAWRGQVEYVTPALEAAAAIRVEQARRPSPSISEGEVEAAARAIRKALTDHLVDAESLDAWDVDVLLVGCQKAMGRGYAKPEEAATNLACDAARAALLAASKAKATTEVEVAPLVWKQNWPNDPQTGYATVEAINRYYVVDHDEPRFYAKSAVHGSEMHDTFICNVTSFEEAKAACQSDFATRIRSALVGGE